MYSSQEKKSGHYSTEVGMYKSQVILLALQPPCEARDGAPAFPRDSCTISSSCICARWGSLSDGLGRCIHSACKMKKKKKVDDRGVRFSDTQGSARMSERAGVSM